MSRQCVIKIEADVLGGTELSGMYIQSYDPQDSDRQGYGRLRVTGDIRQALKFADFSEALNFWKQQSPIIPLREDGKPNRPLTSFTITMDFVEDSAVN